MHHIRRIIECVFPIIGGNPPVCTGGLIPYYLYERPELMWGKVMRVYCHGSKSKMTRSEVRKKLIIRQPPYELFAELYEWAFENKGGKAQINIMIAKHSGLDTQLASEPEPSANVADKNENGQRAGLNSVKFTRAELTQEESILAVAYALPWGIAKKVSLKYLFPLCLKSGNSRILETCKHLLLKITSEHISICISHGVYKSLRWIVDNFAVRTLFDPPPYNESLYELLIKEPDICGFGQHGNNQTLIQLLAYISTYYKYAYYTYHDINDGKMHPKIYTKNIKMIKRHYPTLCMGKTSLTYRPGIDLTTDWIVWSSFDKNRAKLEKKIGMKFLPTE